MKPIKLEVNSSDCKSIQLHGKKPLVGGLQYVVKKCCLPEVLEAEMQLNAEGEMLMRKILDKVSKDDECVNTYYEWYHEYMRGREDDRIRQMQLATELPARHAKVIQLMANRGKDVDEEEVAIPATVKRRREEEVVVDEIDLLSESELRGQIVDTMGEIQKLFFDANTESLRKSLRHLKRARQVLQVERDE